VQKVKGNSVQKLEWKQMDRQTNKQTEAIALPPVLMWSISTKFAYTPLLFFIFI